MSRGSYDEISVMEYGINCANYRADLCKILQLVILLILCAIFGLRVRFWFGVTRISILKASQRCSALKQLLMLCNGSRIAWVVSVVP